jgi:hypothetical protein
VKTGSEFRITREGWVQRKSGGVWRPLTSHYFWDNDHGAQIVCENLGYGKGVRTKTRNPNNREAFDPIGYRRCAASHKHLTQCRHHGGPNNNDRSAQANVRCSGKPWKPHYVKTGSQFRITREGFVYRRDKSGTWRPVTSHYFWDNDHGAQLVCEDLGYGKGVRTKTRNHHNREHFDAELGYRRCAANHRHILHCRKHGGPNNNDRTAHAHVKCSGKPWVPHYVKSGSEFRITREGWVERKARDNRWRPLTSHYFWDNNHGASLVCRNLGYANGTTSKKRN